MKINNEYNIGDMVYLTTDDSQKRMVIKIMINENGLLYCLTLGTQETWHFPIEISKEKTYLNI